MMPGIKTKRPAKNCVEMKKAKSNSPGIPHVEDAIRKAYEQTELILSSITSILIGVNHQDRITHWNGVAEKTFGIPARLVKNKSFSSCGINWEPRPIIAGISECREKNLPVRLQDVEFKRPTGQKGFLGITIIPLRHETGPVECILFGADITERKRIEQLKDEFVSTVSHELRTPLTIIKEGVSQVLEGILGNINDDQRRFLNISLESIDRLGRIVDDLLDISKIEAGKLELKRAPVDIAGLAKGVALAYHFQSKQKGLEIITHFPPSPIEVYVDRDRIIQVFTNLISNALKFTDKGRIEIVITDKQNSVECSLSDTGRGIAQEDLPKVFNKFQQFNRTAGPGDKGTGLGLAICKGIVESHRGTIHVESKLEEGTKFVFTLPKYTAEELFREYIAKGLEVALRDETSLSLIVFDVKDYDLVKEKLGAEKTLSLMQNLENLIKEQIRKHADVAVKDTRAIIMLLPGMTKEDALIIAGRIQQTFDLYLAKEKLKKEIGIACRVATFPDDGNTEDELLAKIGES